MARRRRRGYPSRGRRNRVRRISNRMRAGKRARQPKPGKIGHRR